MSVTSRTVLRDLEWLLPQIHEVVPCPNLYRNGPAKDNRAFHCLYEEGKIFDIVMHLNDECRWTREQIADWLDTLDVDLEFPIEPSPRPAQPTAQFITDKCQIFACGSYEQWTTTFNSASIVVDMSSLSVSMEEQAKKTADAFKAMCAAKLEIRPDPEVLKLIFGGMLKSSGDPSTEVNSPPPFPNKNKVYPQPKLSKKERKDGRRHSSH